MGQETFFTLSEYKENYERLKGVFIEAYVDNDEEEFISLQIEWYQRCLDNTKLKHGFAGDTIGWFPKSLLDGNGVIWEINEKIRNEDGGIDQIAAQNLSVSFKKILTFLQLLQEKTISAKDPGKPSAAQWALYHYYLQKNNILPPFHEKLKEIKALSKEYGIGWKNFEMKYNVINNSQGLEGYSEGDVKRVLLLLNDNFPSLIPEFEKLTLHVS
jgi:hypothetical protein